MRVGVSTNGGCTSSCPQTPSDSERGGGGFGKIFSWNREDVLNISTAFNAWVFTHHMNGHDVLARQQQAPGLQR